MRTAVACPEPEPVNVVNNTATWAWAEPSDCFVSVNRDTARTASILNTALDWYGTTSLTVDDGWS